MCFTCYLSLSVFSQESSTNPLPKVPKWKTQKAAQSYVPRLTGAGGPYILEYKITKFIKLAIINDKLFSYS